MPGYFIWHLAFGIGHSIMFVGETGLNNMVLLSLRALFILLMAAIGYYFLKEQAGAQFYQIPDWLMLTIMLCVGVLIVCIDILAPRRKLAIFSGTFLGLIVGMSTSYGFSFIVTLMVDRYMPRATDADKT